MQRPNLRTGLLVALGLTTFMELGSAVGAQIDAGYLAAVPNLKTTATYSAAERRSERTLTLVPAVNGDNPGVSLVVSATFSGRNPTETSDLSVVVRAHYMLNSDDRTRAAQARRESYQLILAVDPETPDGVTLRFFPNSWGYGGFVAPGDAIPVAYFTLTAADLRALALAHRLRGSVLWTDFVLSDQQLAALRAFTADVLPPRG